MRTTNVINFLEHTSLPLVCLPILWLREGWFKERLHLRCVFMKQQQLETEL